MSVTNADKPITKQDLANFYENILPYLGGMPEVLANKFSRGDLFSTDEKMVGCWIDNRPLYQKTVSTGGSVPSGATLIERLVQTGYDTIRYTKNSDSANSFNIGSDTDYSTEEKIVGTWIDNSYIYQKTINLTNISVPPTTGGGSILIESNTSVKDLINAEGMSYWAGNYQDTIPSCGYWTKAYICKNGTNIEMNYERPSGTDTILNLYITIRYTKSSS